MDEHSLICWFCGKVTELPYLDGWAIGHIAHSSFNDPSGVTIAPPTELVQAENQKHFAHDTCKICESCLDTYWAELAVASDYEIAQRLMKEEAMFDSIDYETGLVSMSERSFHFRCWFECFPGPLMTEFRSLPLGKLFELGLRMTASISLSEQCLNGFLARFSDAGNEIATSAFLRHFSTHLTVTNIEKLSELSRARAVISDIAVFDAYRIRNGLSQRRRDSNSAWKQLEKN